MRTSSEKFPLAIDTLSGKAQTALAGRPVLQSVVSRILEDIEEYFGEQGAPVTEVERLNREILPLFESAVKPAAGTPDASEQAVTALLEKWAELRTTLKHPGQP